MEEDEELVDEDELLTEEDKQRPAPGERLNIPCSPQGAVGRLASHEM